MRISRVVVVAAVVVAIAGFGCQPSLEQQAQEIHARVLTVDTHIDWPSRQVRNPAFDPGAYHEPGKISSGQWDLIRMQQGGLDAVYMSIFKSQGARTDSGHAEAKAHALKLIEATKKMVADYPELAELATTPDDAYRIAAAGKHAIFMGMENGSPIGVDLSNVQMFYDLGIRYITLTHSRNNEIGDSSTDSEQEWGGLSPFGEQVVQEMNRLGIMVDISHVHDDTFWDVIALTKAPVIASHSSARALCDHPRNMNDEMLAAVKENGGVVQLCLLGAYIKQMPPHAERDSAMVKLRAQFRAYFSGAMSEEEMAAFDEEYRRIRTTYPRATLEDAIDHIDHMVKVMGIDHIGIGSDFDGGGGLQDIDDVSEMPNITLALLKRGYSEEEIGKIWGGNLMRVHNRVIEVAKQIQAEQQLSD